MTRLSDEQYLRIAGRLLKSLEEEGSAQFKAGRPQLLNCIVQVFRREDNVLAELDLTARKLLDEHLRAAPPGIDRQKMLVMIRKKLAQERGVPL